MQSSATKIAETAQTALNASGVLNDAQASSYWTYHLARLGFFTVQGLASLLAYDAAAARRGAPSSAQAGMSDPVANESRVATMLQSRTSLTLVGEALAMFYQDFRNIQSGKYNLPWDMVTSGHRQFNPLYILNKGRLMLNEAVSTLTKRLTPGSSTDVWMDSSLYPSYYLNTFHYQVCHISCGSICCYACGMLCGITCIAHQTDGWLSPSSAKVYETSTETLFVGRQDAMQRQTLVPISDFMRECVVEVVACVL